MVHHSSSSSSSTEDFDIVIISGGAAGNLIAWTFAAKGQRVATIKQKYVGGSCPKNLGVGAGEVMSAVPIAMMAELRYTAIRDVLLAHPTLVEGLHVLFASAPTKRPKRSSS